MKKIIALLLVLVMSVGLIACGNSNAPAADDKPAADAPAATDAPAANAGNDAARSGWWTRLANSSSAR